MDGIFRNMLFTLKVSYGEKVYRVLEVKGMMSLEKLAGEILHSFDFELDHAFGFYNNVDDWLKSTEMYILFRDLPDWTDFEEDYDPSHSIKGVISVKVYEAFEPEKKLLFLFDYGDGWEFVVECENVSRPISYPRITKSVGKPPKQY